MGGEGLKIVVYIAAFAAFLFLPRFFSSNSIVPPEPYIPPPPDEPTKPDTKDSPVVPLDSGNIRIVEFGFRYMDADVGPPDPLNFYEELVLRLENVEHHHRWVASIFICTPQGLSALMKQERWLYLFGTDHIIVPEFNMKLILEAVLDFYRTIGKTAVDGAEERL